MDALIEGMCIYNEIRTNNNGPTSAGINTPYPVKRRACVVSEFHGSMNNMKFASL
jgi:hypothetical protein